MNSTASQAIEGGLIQAEVLAPLAEVLQRLGVSVEPTYGAPTGNPAVRLDADGQAAVGRLTWWSDGSFYAEVLRVSDGEQLLSLHGLAEHTHEAVLALKQVAEYVALARN